jgi:hypothetical protein
MLGWFTTQYKRYRMAAPSGSTYRLPSFDASAFLCNPFGTLLRYWWPLLCLSHQIAPPTGHNNLVGLNTWCSPAVLPVVPHVRPSPYHSRRSCAVSAIQPLTPAIILRDESVLRDNIRQGRRRVGRVECWTLHVLRS